MASKNIKNENTTNTDQQAEINFDDLENPADFENAESSRKKTPFTLLEEEPAEEMTYFGSSLYRIGELADTLDSFTQARILTDMARSCIQSMGWNRAFKEQVLYGSVEQAMALQDNARDDAGFFIGVESTEPGITNGHLTTYMNLMEKLSDRQFELVSDLEAKEATLWDVYDLIAQEWKDVTGSKQANPVKPTRPQRLAGIETLEDLVEDAKLGALRYKLDQFSHSEEAANARAKALAQAKVEQLIQQRQKRSQVITK